MESSGRFKEQLKKLVIKRIFILIVGAIFLFFTSVFLVNTIKFTRMSEENIKYIEKTFKKLNTNAEDYLNNIKTISSFKEISTDKENFDNYFNIFNRKNKVKANYIITKNWKTVASSFDSSTLSDSIIGYNNAICNNAKNNAEIGEVYRSVFSEKSKNPYYIIVKPIMENGKINSFLSLYFSGSDWSYLTSNNNDYNSIITDSRDNVIFYNKASLIKNNYKFFESNSSNFKIEDERYWLEKKEVKGFGVNIYSIIHYPKGPEFLLYFLIISIIGIFMYKLFIWMSNEMSSKYASSVDNLATEIKYITDEEPLYRISIHSEDEFEDIGNQINVMLDTIKNLDDKNTELIKFNNRIEVSQLTAQINPHFLYNSLDIISNLTIINPKLAKEVILNLTKVLRYSIDNKKTDVFFDEDLMFLKDYLFIQNLRFSDRLEVDFDIDDDCLNCLIPKMALQPLIENSIKYGFIKQKYLKINIKGYVDGDFLVLIVKDDGPGIEESKLKEVQKNINEEINLSQSYGIFNISRRLKLQYSKKSGIKIDNYENGLIVRVEVFQGDL